MQEEIFNYLEQLSDGSIILLSVLLLFVLVAILDILFTIIKYTILGINFGIGYILKSIKKIL